MKNIFFLLLLLQGAPKGVVTGTVRSASGMPAAGVRVYAMAVKDGNAGQNDLNTGTVLESIAQTDETGRYRLEIPAGRYYIAAGSLDTPTYFPGTPDVKAARVISIASAAAIDAIDFSRFVPAARTPSGIGGGIVRIGGGIVQAAPPGSTGVLSGIIRYRDGRPAAGVPVTAVPANVQGGGTAVVGTISALPPGVGGTGRMVCMQTSTVTPNPGGGGFSARMSVSCLSSTQTDNTGRYRITNVSPGTYDIVAGFANFPAYYPGVASALAAIPITTTPTTNIDTLDFVIPSLSTGTSVRGRVLAAESMPAGGVTLELRNRNVQMGMSVLPTKPPQQAVTGPDGTFEISDVIPGRYTIEARLAGVSPMSRGIDVAEPPVTGVDFAFPVAILSGQVLWEDGGEFADAQRLREVAVVTVTNRNKIQTTFFPLDAAGKFSRAIENNEYRFYLRSLPDDYVIKSITAGTSDLLKETLKVDGTAAVRIEVRLGKRVDAGTRVRGRVVDSATGAPLPAQQMELCCLPEGPIERISTSVGADGSFEFKAVPPGTYTAELTSAVPSRKGLFLVEHSIEVGSQDLSGITLASTPQLVPVTVQMNVEGILPARPRVSIVLTGTSGVPIPAELRDGRIAAWLPAGDRYAVRVSMIPDGFVVKSMTSSGNDLLNGGRVTVGVGADQTLPPIVISLARSP